MPLRTVEIELRDGLREGHGSDDACPRGSGWEQEDRLSVERGASQQEVIPMRTLLIVPIAVLFGIPAIAQTTSTTTRTTTTAPAITQYRPLEDMPIVDSTGQKIGEVEDVLIDQAGKIAALTVDVGGFLGVAKKEVVVDVAQVAHDGTGRLVSNLTKQQLEALPAWKQ
jgi:sporulation protein YlmC with PRC-barrel domain